MLPAAPMTDADRRWLIAQTRAVAGENRRTIARILAEELELVLAERDALGPAGRGGRVGRAADEVVRLAHSFHADFVTADELRSGVVGVLGRLAEGRD